MSYMENWTNLDIELETWREFPQTISSFQICFSKVGHCKGVDWKLSALERYLINPFQPADVFARDGF